VPADRLAAALRAAGLPEVPERFSVTPLHQEIPAASLTAIDELIHAFERVTTRRRWQQATTRLEPEITRQIRREVCFFSAWDFHLPPEHPDEPLLIEFNDNGSGLLISAIVNHLYYGLAGLSARADLEPPPDTATFERRLLALIARELEEFFGGRPPGIGLVLDDPESLREGRFRRELILLRELLRGAGWEAELSAPHELEWDGRLLRNGRTVSFVVNRSTDFHWRGADFAALRTAYRAGEVYVAPNPFTYATRSDKRLLELLSRPLRDAELGILAAERSVLAARVPETWLLRPENLDELARHKHELVFKPVHGFAGHGLLPSHQLGRSRLHRLLRGGTGYVAQRRVDKPRLRGPGEAPIDLWTDVRVWAYRGHRFQVSGRASRRPDRLDLSPPGGWLPTYARRGGPEPGSAEDPDRPSR
jgi:hypothetical protein